MLEHRKLLLCALLIAFSSQSIFANESEDIAKKLANSIAAMISLPIQEK